MLTKLSTEGQENILTYSRGFKSFVSELDQKPKKLRKPYACNRIKRGMLSPHSTLLTCKAAMPRSQPVEGRVPVSCFNPMDARAATIASASACYLLRFPRHNRCFYGSSTRFGSCRETGARRARHPRSIECCICVAGYEQGLRSGLYRPHADSTNQDLFQPIFGTLYHRESRKACDLHRCAALKARRIEVQR